MEIRNLITFTKVAELQSLSGAARSLGYAQSTVTMQMQQLEQELGIALYERVGKQIRITQAGQELLGYAVHIIKLSEEALQVGKGDSSAIEGSLRLGILKALNNDEFASRMDHYLERNPRVELDVRVEQSSMVLLDMMRHNEIDLMVTLDTLISDSDLIHGEKDVPVEVHFYVSVEHELAGQRGLDLQRILSFPQICIGEADVYGRKIERLLEEVMVVGSDNSVRTGNTRIMVRDQDLALHMTALQGRRGKRAGVVLAPDLVACQYVRNGQLTALNYEMPDCRVWRQTIYHRNKWVTRAMNAWLSISEDTEDE